MSSRSSLLKRAIAPLLAVAAVAAPCAPARAATASFSICQAVNSGSYYQGVAEQVDCFFTGPGTTYWTKAEFHAVGGGDVHASTKTPNIDGGAGDYYYPQQAGSAIYLGPTSSGTYTCWAVCYLENSGTNYTASTGGSDFVTF